MAINPIIEMLSSTNKTMDQTNQIKQMINSVRNSRDPYEMLNSMASKNPNVASILGMLNQNGNSPKDAFFKACNDKGIDPYLIINRLS